MGPPRLFADSFLQDLFEASVSLLSLPPSLKILNLLSVPIHAFLSRV
jgi:hypothetical protein